MQVEDILRNFRGAVDATKDSIKQSILTASSMKKINLQKHEIELLCQIIDASFDNVIGNSENSLKRSLKAFYDDTIKKG